MAIRRRNAASPDRPALLRERQQLLERIAEIDRQLGTRERAVLTPPEHR